MDTKKLRQKILDLAIRGKLVPQDPNDEPASVLLERIKAEKERLIKEGKIKRSKKPASDTPHYENVPFEIPENWEWIRLEELLTLVSGQDFPPTKYNDEGIGTPYITGASNIENEQLIINRWTETPSVYSVYGDILVVCKGSGVGKIAMNHLGNVHIARQIQAIRDETKIIENDYIKFCIYSNISDIISQANGLIPGLKRELLLSLLLPIPPLQEQKRIVQEVNNCLALLTLIEVNTSELQDVLRRTRFRVLDLAIRGKLVPQKSYEEPAIELLKRINPNIQIPCDNPHYQKLPQSWCICTMADIAVSELGKTLDREKNKGEYKPYLCSANVLWNSFDLSGLKQMRFEDDETDRYSIKKNDLIICEGGDAGRCAVWTSDDSIMFQNALHRVRFYHGISPYYIMYVLMFLKQNGLLEEYCKGVTIKHFTKTALYGLQIPLPPIDEQYRIVSKIEEYFWVLSNIEAAIK